MIQQNSLSFPVYPLSSCQYHSKAFTLKSFSFKVIYWFLAFESLSFYSEYFTFQKFLYLLCCFFMLLSFEYLFHPKSFYWFLAFKRFLSISNLLHSRNSFTLHAFILRSYLLVFLQFDMSLQLNLYSCNLVSHVFTWSCH